MDDKFNYLEDRPSKTRTTPEPTRGDVLKSQPTDWLSNLDSNVRTAREDRDPDYPLRNVLPMMKSLVPLLSDIPDIVKQAGGLVNTAYGTMRNDPDTIMHNVSRASMLANEYHAGNLDTFLRKYPEFTIGMAAPELAGKAIQDEVPWHLNSLVHGAIGNGKEMGIPERVKPVISEIIGNGSSLASTADPKMPRYDFNRPLIDIGETEPHQIMSYSDYPLKYRKNDPSSGYFSHDKEVANTLGQFFVRPGEQPNTAEVRDLYKFWSQTDNTERPINNTLDILRHLVDNIKNESSVTTQVEQLAAKYPKLFKPFPIKGTVDVPEDVYKRLQFLVSDKGKIPEDSAISWMKADKESKSPWLDSEDKKYITNDYSKPYTPKGKIVHTKDGGSYFQADPETDPIKQYIMDTSHGQADPSAVNSIFEKLGPLLDPNSKLTKEQKLGLEKIITKKYPVTRSRMLNAKY